MDEGETTNIAQIQDWEVRYTQASNYLYATVSEEIKNTLINCDIAHEMWERLSVQYMQNTSGNKHLLKQQFFQLQFDTGKDVMHHITSMGDLIHSDVCEPIHFPSTGGF